MRNTNKFLLIPYLLWMVIFIIVPVVLLIYFSFLDINGHFSFTNYQQIFTTKYLKMFAYSILYAALITIITLAISYPAAYYITRSKFGVINQFFHLFNLPSFNLLFTTGAFLVVASYIYIPFMILPIFNSMKAIPNNLLQASSDLGASPFYTFRKVIMPLTKEGVMTGIQVTFIPSLSLFMITRLIAGNKVINIGTAIEEQFLTIQNYGMGSTIAIFLIVFMAFILIITKSSNGRG